MVRNSKHLELYCGQMLHFSTSNRYMLLKLPFFLFCFALSSGVVDARKSTDHSAVPSNGEIIADETSRLILDKLGPDDVLQIDNERVIEQPLNVQMDAPAGIRERILSNLMAGGIRLAMESEQHQTLKIDWEADNLLVDKRGGLSTRIIRSDVIFTWFDSGREIQKTWKESFSREDEVATDQASLLAGRWNPASFHQKESSRRVSVIRRFAEPALFTGAIAVTIYLLYNVRS